jgi:signal transduction histidine kinase
MRLTVRLVVKSSANAFFASTGDALMLLEFIIDNREKVIALTWAKAAKRLAPRPTEVELTNGVPIFLDQLADVLRRADDSVKETMERSAAAHAAARFGLGHSVAQVVHDYGDLCEAVTELAEAVDAPITTEEFQTLTRCLDIVVAEAVTEYARLQERSMVEGEAERSGSLAHELRNRITSAQIAFAMIRSGRAPVAGGVATLVTRSLDSMATLINRSLIEVRLDSGHSQRQRVRLHDLIAEAQVEGTMGARAHGILLSVAPTDPGIEVEADPFILAGAVANLLQNAFKFTPAGGSVSLRTSVAGGRVEIEIEDQCGGLPVHTAEQLFGAFQQRGANRSGLGLGLFISRKAVEASGGVIRVRDLPSRGCVFTIELPLRVTTGLPHPAE